MNNKNKLLILSLVLLLALFLFFSASLIKAAGPLQLQVKFPCPDFPGATCPADEKAAAQSLAAYIARFYQFALALAGMLAFGMIIFGAIQYTVSAGNVARQSDARDRIFQALWGVALLLGAYLILHTIDPKLVSLKDPNITKLTVPIETKTRAVGGAGDSCQLTADCSSGYVCQNGKCTLSEERRQAQETGKYQWVDFDDPEIKARYGNECSGMRKVRYADNYCPGAKLGPNYQCCGSL
jgi:hypothetical protein